jgi:hypothetical protein
VAFLYLLHQGTMSDFSEYRSAIHGVSDYERDALSAMWLELRDERARGDAHDQLLGSAFNDLLWITNQVTRDLEDNRRAFRRAVVAGHATTDLEVAQAEG